MPGFAVILGTTTFSAAGPFTYPAPKNFRQLAVTVNPGSAGNPGCPGPPFSPGICPCTGCPQAPVPGPPGSPGVGGCPSSFKSAGSTTYLRKTSTIVPRQAIAGVVGAGGPGGAGGSDIQGSGAPGAPGSTGSVVVVVS